MQVNTGAPTVGSGVVESIFHRFFASVFLVFSRKNESFSIFSEGTLSGIFEFVLFTIVVFSKDVTFLNCFSG